MVIKNYCIFTFYGELNRETGQKNPDETEIVPITWVSEDEIDCYCWWPSTEAELKRIGDKIAAVDPPSPNSDWGKYKGVIQKRYSKSLVI